MIAQLLRMVICGLALCRDLRYLTRMRASASQEASRMSSRIQKVLEDANLKQASVRQTLSANQEGLSATCLAFPQCIAALAMQQLATRRGFATH